MIFTSSMLSPVSTRSSSILSATLMFTLSSPKPVLMSALPPDMVTLTVSMPSPVLIARDLAPCSVVTVKISSSSVAVIVALDLSPTTKVASFGAFLLPMKIRSPPILRFSSLVESERFWTLTTTLSLAIMRLFMSTLMP